MDRGHANGQNSADAHPLFPSGTRDLGDEAACVIVDEDGSILLEDVWNGFDDLEEAGWREESP